MALPDARKRANAKWDKENMRSAACKITTDEHAAFKAYAEQHGKTISGMLLEYIRGCISESEQKLSLVTRDELLSLMSVHGKDNIIEAVSKIDSAQAKDYLLLALLIVDKQKELDL